MMLILVPSKSCTKWIIWDRFASWMKNKEEDEEEEGEEEEEEEKQQQQR